MSREILNRIMTASAYQKKAVYALFPEEMGVHLNAIEKEIKAMAVELMEAWLRDEDEKDGSESMSYGNSMNDDVNNIKSRSDNYHQRSGTKKINIT